MRRFTTKMPPIFYGANLYRFRKPTPLRNAYVQLQTDWNLPYIDFPISPHRYKIAQAIIWQWMHVDGFPVRTKYIKETECLRLWRCIRVYRAGHFRFVKLKVKDRLGLLQLKKEEMAIYGPFFSTPRQFRKDWEEYFENRVRQLRNPYCQLSTRISENPRDTYETGTCFVVYREL